MDSNLVNIEEFYEELKEEYPELTLSDFNNICRGPFRFIKEVISSGELKDIRLQYFGIFQVSKSRVKYNKKMLEENYKKGNIPESRYFKKKKILENYESR